MRVQQLTQESLGITVNDSNDEVHSSVAFPRRSLVLPGLVPVVVLGATLGLDALGMHLNPHGIAGILTLMMMVFAVGAALYELVIVTRAVRLLKQFPALHTTDNLFALLFAVTFTVAMLLLTLRALLN